MKIDKTPFMYGQIVDNTYFVNRQKELHKFQLELTSGIHQIVISPRRWGKSSFVKQAANNLKSNEKIVFIFIDLFSIRTEREFFETISKQIISSTYNTFDEVRTILSKLLSSLTPKISLSPDPTQNIEIDFNWKSKTESIAEILNLAEKIAEKKKIRIIMCFDEFQNIANFTESKSFQKLLRSYWQKHKHVTYCLYGSNRSMMEEMFQKQSMPFYRFGTTIFLQKINEVELSNYIIKRFKQTKKTIEPEIAKKISQEMENHPYYVQQMAHYVWLNTNDNAGIKQYNDAINNMLTHNLILYQKDFETLSISQIKCLKALVENTELKMTSIETLKKYDLGSSATVIRALEALEKKEIIDRFTGKLEFVDPGFKLWLKSNIFK